MNSFISNVKNVSKQDEQEYEEGQLPDDYQLPVRASIISSLIKPIDQRYQLEKKTSHQNLIFQSNKNSKLIQKSDSQSDVIYETIPSKAFNHVRKKDKKQQKIQYKSNNKNYQNYHQKRKSPSSEKPPQRQQLTPQPFQGQMPFYHHMPPTMGVMPNMYLQGQPYPHPIYQPNMHMPMMGYPHPQYIQNYPPGYLPHPSQIYPHHQPWNGHPQGPIYPPQYQHYQEQNFKQNKELEKPVIDPRKIKTQSLKQQIKKRVDILKDKQDILIPIRWLIKNQQKVSDPLYLQNSKKVQEALQNQNEKQIITEIITLLQAPEIIKKIKQRKLTQKLMGQKGNSQGIKKLLNMIKDPRKNKQKV